MEISGLYRREPCGHVFIGVRGYVSQKYCTRCGKAHNMTEYSLVNSLDSERVEKENKPNISEVDTVEYIYEHNFRDIANTLRYIADEIEKNQDTTEVVLVRRALDKSRQKVVSEQTEDETAAEPDEDEPTESMLLHTMGPSATRESAYFMLQSAARKLELW